MKEIIDAWHIHNRINLYLLDAIDEKYLGAVPVTSKGRNVGEQFAHMHNVRLMWLKVASPALFEEQTKIEKENPITKKLLAKQLEQSGNAIVKLLEKGFTEGKIKGFKPSPAAFYSYLVSHESHHRGQVTIALKQSGHKLDPKVLYGMWEWGSR